jgi:hypothetical protein
LHVELDEGAGQLLFFPWTGPLAGVQPHDRILDPDRLAGPKRQVADDPVALVQQTDDRDPFGHRSDPGLVGNFYRSLRAGRLLLKVAGLLAAAAGKPPAKQGRHHQHTDRRFSHLYSGVQGL